MRRVAQEQSPFQRGMAVPAVRPAGVSPANNSDVVNRANESTQPNRHAALDEVINLRASELDQQTFECFGYRVAAEGRPGCADHDSAPPTSRNGFERAGRPTSLRIFSPNPIAQTATGNTFDDKSRRSPPAGSESRNAELGAAVIAAQEGKGRGDRAAVTSSPERETLRRPA